MIKRFWIIALLPALFLFACNNAGKDAAQNAKADTARLTVASFDTAAHSWVEKPVIIQGTVLHTCKHGGKRMFLADGVDSITVEVTTGANIAKFDDALIGSRVQVIGTLKEERIDSKYLNEWEAEVKKPAENHDAGIHTAAKGHEDQGVQEKLDQINALRDELKKSGKDHLSFYSIEAISYKEMK
jgi:hypothetical protein